MIRSVSLSLSLAGAIAVTLMAQGSTDPRFQYERVAEAIGNGPQRLDVDVALLTGSQPFAFEAVDDRFIARRGLADLRLFNQNNVEIPYLLIEPTTDRAAFGLHRVLPIAAIDTPDTKSSGFEVDTRSLTTIDAIVLSGIKPPYLKRFRLEGSGDRERWTELVHEGTAFNLPAERLQNGVIEFEPGVYRYLRVTWDDTNSARVAPPSDVMLRQPRRLAPGPVLRSAVVVARRPSEPGRSRFRLTLPAARLPIVAFELSVAGGGNVMRSARVLEAGFAGQGAEPRLIGSGQLRRVVRDTIVAERLRVPVRLPPTEPQLDLVVDDGDNPPLELDGVTAVFAELPWIYFEAPPGPITVRYGNPKSSPPRYDLEAARANLPASPSRASWRSQPPVAREIEEEGLPMADTGGAMSSEGFEYVRDIPAGPAGLIALQMDLAVMAHSGRAPRRLRDVRIVDASGLQVPYLLESRDEPLITDVRIERQGLPAGVEPPSPRVTSYRVNLPFQNLPNPTLMLTTKARVFQRTVTIGTVTAASERQPARFVRRAGAAWTHADQSVPARALSFSLPDSAITEDLYLLIDEGDNQPLPIDKVTLLVPQYAARLFRKADQPLRLLYGRDDLDSPQYDLQLLAGQVLGRPAADVIASPERAFGGGGRDSSSDLVPPAVFWSALAATVVVLLALVVRLMKQAA